MKVVGRLHSTGVSRRMMIARPYPAPCTMSSVPYVPPETMKKVAATSGQSVRWADFLVELLAVGLVTCDETLGVDNSYGFLLNHLDSVAAFNVRKISSDARGICEYARPLLTNCRAMRPRRT